MAEKKPPKKRASTTKKVRKKTKKKPSRTKKPTVTAVVACDSIMQQMPIGKPILAGVFDNISVADPKKPFRPFTVMMKLLGGNGIFRIGLHIEAPSRAKRDPGSEQEIDCGSPEDIHTGTMLISGLDVSKEGMVKIFVTVDGKKSGNPCAIMIVHADDKAGAKK